MNNRYLAFGLSIASITTSVFCQQEVMQVEHATRNIFTSAQMFLSAALVLPPKINAVVATLGPVVADVQKHLDTFKTSQDFLVRLDSVASLFDQTAIAIELLIGSYIPQGGTTDYGKHNYPGLVKDIAAIVAIGDAKVGAKINEILPLVQDKVAYLDVFGQSLHEIVEDLKQAPTKGNILEQTQTLMTALNNLPNQINLITTTFNGVIEQLKTDYAKLTQDGTLANKVEAVADVVNQLAIVAELCVGSKLLAGSTVDAANHSFVGVLNDFNHVLVALDPESGTHFGTLLAVAHEKVSYIDLVANALHKVAGNLAKMKNR